MLILKINGLITSKIGLEQIWKTQGYLPDFQVTALPWESLSGGVESRAGTLLTFLGKGREVFFYGPPWELQERERKVPPAAGSPSPYRFSLWEERGSLAVSHQQVAVSPQTRGPAWNLLPVRCPQISSLFPKVTGN